MTTAPPRVDPRDRARRTTSPPVVERPAADVFMRRVLRIHDAEPRLGEDELRRGFSQSMVVSGLRCLLTYILIPFVTPFLGLAAGVGPVIGIPIGVVAVFFNIRTMRRFWAADHRWRWAYTAIGLSVIALLVVLIGRDLAHLLT